MPLAHRIHSVVTHNDGFYLMPVVMGGHYVRQQEEKRRRSLKSQNEHGEEAWQRSFPGTSGQ